MKAIFISSIFFFMTWMTRPQPLSLIKYRIDSDQSTVSIDVARAGLFSFLGHNHTVAARKFSGTVHCSPGKLEDCSVYLSIESNSLTVLDPGTPEKERNEIQATMEGPKVLDASAFPEITFSSTQVRKTNKAGSDLEIILTGRLDLHGIEKVISFPVRISFERNALRARGTVAVAQTDFGITPVNAVGGTVRVKDRVKLNFDIRAEKTS